MIEFAGEGRRAAGLLLVVLVLALSACGQKTAPDAGPGQGEAVAATPAPGEQPTQGAPPNAAAPGEVASPGEGAPAQPDGERPTPGQPSPAQSPDFGEKHNTGLLKITLSATCVTRTTTMKALLQGPEKAGVAAVVGYSDNQAHGAMITGESDASGRFEWVFLVAPDVPLGEARLLAQTTGPNWEGESGTADAVFRVVERMEDC
jgi:hypothetical protein